MNEEALLLFMYLWIIIGIITMWISMWRSYLKYDWAEDVFEPITFLVSTVFGSCLGLFMLTFLIMSFLPKSWHPEPVKQWNEDGWHSESKE